jgi:hypothetical protein
MRQKNNRAGLHSMLVCLQGKAHSLMHIRICAGECNAVDESKEKDGTCLEYRVKHPPWQLRHVAIAQVTGNMNRLWGKEIGDVLADKPEFSVWIPSSPFKIYSPSLVEP